MLKRGGRLVAVGDRHQAIYGFTGADSNALDLIAKAVNAKSLPLTVTYRCPKSVVAYAQQYVNHIQAHESAPEGVVRNLSDETPIHTVAKPGDAILCRFNAPVVKLAYTFIAAGVPAKVEGREIGTGLKTLAKRWKIKTFNALLGKLETYQEREVAKYRAKEQESNAVAVEDKVNCLKLIIQRVMDKNKPGNPIDALCAEIDSIFSDDIGAECVLLSTIHKSKGREWDTVYWLQTGPSKWARKDWELEQEKNLCYVAATRAKNELVLTQVEVK
jgi:superfamily I DNA/RNA helicase